MNGLATREVSAYSPADVVICGAGIAGISAACWLAVEHGLKVVLVDEGAPLSLTSDKSTECYRNWWPGPDDAIVRLMDRSIDLLERWARESGNIFNLNRRGYVYATADAARSEQIRREAEAVSALGAGKLRVHGGDSAGKHGTGGRESPGDDAYQPAQAEGFEDQPTGADLILDRKLIHQHFPYLAPETVALLHTRRAGWFSGQQLGMYLLERAKAHGARLVSARVEAVKIAHGRVEGVCLRGGETIATRHFVNAAGPFVRDVGQLLGVDLPVFSELHLKLAFPDRLGVVPRDAPMLIWDDPQELQWDDDERAALSEDAELRWLLEPFPAGVHTRPEGPPGSPILLMLWDYHRHPVEPIFPLPLDPYFPELVLRGLCRMLPGLRAYIGRAPRPVLDGGYYTKTKENRPLVGPLPVSGAYVIGALSGFGLMAAPAAGELLAAHITGGHLPAYAPAFSLERYFDPAYQDLLETWGNTGQL